VVLGIQLLLWDLERMAVLEELEDRTHIAIVHSMTSWRGEVGCI